MDDISRRGVPRHCHVCMCVRRTETKRCQPEIAMARYRAEQSLHRVFPPQQKEIEVDGQENGPVSTKSYRGYIEPLFNTILRIMRLDMDSRPGHCALQSGLNSEVCLDECSRTAARCPSHPVSAGEAAKRGHTAILLVSDPEGFANIS